ncbi:MAG: ATP-binding protein [Bacteroidia bacterium]
MNSIIGRKKEIEQLKRVVGSKKSEFVVLYGRRRVGKTFLVREFFNYQFAFQLTGLANANTGQQLQNFFASIVRQSPQTSPSSPKNWVEAFQALIDHLETFSGDEKKIVFLDELPWFDTARSDFMMALEHFWNSWATTRKDIVLVACGSAASWMINKLINNHGGLHNRLTQRIRIEPFNLNETAQLLKANGCTLDQYQIVQLYMTMGGIPYYLDQIVPGKSAAQNIETLCFTKEGLLVLEFNNLFASLFKNADKYEQIVNTLAKKPLGLTRQDLGKDQNLSSGGSLTRNLLELEESGFIARFPDFNKKKDVYRLVDFYSLFYLKFIQNNTVYDQGAWLNMIDLPSQKSWSGHAFELVCLQHIPQIKKALGISGVLTEHSMWKSKQKDEGAQIDLILDRRDRVINVCEIKFSINPYTISKQYAEKLRNKLGVFQRETQTNKALFMTLITTFGLKANVHSTSLVQNEVTMDALFEE